MGLPTLYRYILREIFNTFCAILLILLTIILSFRLSRFLTLASEGSLDLDAVWKLIALQSIYLGCIIIPIAFVIAVVMVFSRLYNEQEMSAILSSGIAQKHLHFIILTFSIPLSIALLIANLYLIPHIHQQTAFLRSEAQQQASITQLNAQRFQNLSAEITLHTGTLQQNLYQDFFIAQEKPQNNLLIFAETGDIQRQTGEHFLILNNGIRLAWQDLYFPETVQYTQFEKAQLHIPIPENQTNLRTRAIATKELNQSAEHQGEWQMRINPALALLCFSLALPFIARTTPRSGRQNKTIPAFLLFAIYLNLLELAAKAVKKGDIWIYPGSYTLHLILIILTILYALKIKKTL